DPERERLGGEEQLQQSRREEPLDQLLVEREQSRVVVADAGQRERAQLLQRRVGTDLEAVGDLVEQSFDAFAVSRVEKAAERVLSAAPFDPAPAEAEEEPRPRLPALEPLQQLVRAAPAASAASAAASAAREARPAAQPRQLLHPVGALGPDPGQVEVVD